MDEYKVFLNEKEVTDDTKINNEQSEGKRTLNNESLVRQ